MIKRIDNKDYIELKNIKRAKLGKEDIIVLSTEKNLHPEYADKIKKHFGKDFPDNKVLILTGGLTLSTVRKTGDEKLIKLIKRLEKDLEEGNYPVDEDSGAYNKKIIEDLKNLLK